MKIFIIAISLFFLQMIQPTGVKVLLHTIVGQESLEIKSQSGFVVRDPANYKPLRMKKGQKKFVLCNGHDGVYEDKKKLFNTSLIFDALDGTVYFNEKPYHGVFLLQKEGTVCHIINILDLESYVFSVLKTESWPGWPLEINKVMAVVCRTYVLHHILTPRTTKSLYHVKNTNHHQTYAGKHTCPVIKKAVDETAGLFIAYNNHPILAMFDSCCGGIVPGHTKDVVNFTKAPYLKRLYACRYCKGCRVYSWSISYDQDDFIALLQEVSSGIVHDIHAIKVAQKDKAGLVQDCVVTTRRGPFSFAGKTLYRMCKEIKSYCFSIMKKGKKIIFAGKGLGHHMGLCQWGAREMVTQGFDYKKIISFYYPSTTLMKLESKKKSKKYARV